MRIFAESVQENDKLSEVAAFIKSLNVPSRENRYEDSFALTVWSVDDVRENARHDAINNMTEEEIMGFLRYASSGLKDAMVRAGNEGIADLFDDYIREKEKAVSQSSANT